MPAHGNGQASQVRVYPAVDLVQAHAVSVACLHVCRQTTRQWHMLLREKVPATQNMDLNHDESPIHEELNIAWAGTKLFHLISLPEVLTLKVNRSA